MNKEGDPPHPEEHWSDDDFAALSAYLENPEAFTPSTVQPSHLDTLRPEHSAFSRALSDIITLLKDTECEVPLLIDMYISFQHLVRLPVTRNATAQLVELARPDMSQATYHACYAVLLTAEIMQIFALERGQNADAKKAVLRSGLISWLIVHRPDEDDALYSRLLNSSTSYKMLYCI